MGCDVMAEVDLALPRRCLKKYLAAGSRNFNAIGLMLSRSIRKNIQAIAAPAAITQFPCRRDLRRYPWIKLGESKR